MEETEEERQKRLNQWEEFLEKGGEEGEGKQDKTHKAASTNSLNTETVHSAPVNVKTGSEKEKTNERNKEEDKSTSENNEQREDGQPKETSS